jgi:hypothetical protein
MNECGVSERSGCSDGLETSETWTVTNVKMLVKLLVEMLMELMISSSGTA